MAASGEMIIVYISSDEDEGCSKPGGQKKKEIDNKSNIIKKDLDDDCVILDGDPDKPLGFENESLVHGSESDELVIVAEKGQVACRDYPHARHLCARFPFNTNPHEKYCALCHCYVCDTRAPCDLWDGDMSSGDHCHATDKEELWRLLRQCSKQGKMAQLPALNHPVNPPSNAPTLHPTTSLYRPLSAEEGRAVLVAVRSMVTAFDQLTVQTSRLTGTVKWFNCQKGYGFITPDSGDEDLFVHHSSIKSVGYRRRSLAEGEAVEFHIEIRDDGRKMAIEVTGLGTSFVQGATTTRDSNLFDVRGCYKCGETGHLARNCVCVVCYNCGKTGHLARDCSCTGSETDGTDSTSSDTGRYNYSSDSRICYNCGKAGHLMRNCPNTGTESDANDNWHEAGSAFDEELNWE